MTTVMPSARDPLRYRIEAWIQERFNEARRSDLPVPLSQAQFDRTTRDIPWSRAAENCLLDCVCNRGGVSLTRFDEALTDSPGKTSGRLFKIIDLSNQPGLTIYGQMLTATGHRNPHIEYLIGPIDYDQFETSG